MVVVADPLGHATAVPYPSDPSFRAATLALLGQIWKRLPAAVERARSVGVEWCELSTPFVHRVGDEVVAHVGVLELPLVLDGVDQTFAGIHAVCSSPEHRGRGHVRELLERALAWVDERYPGAALWANDPAIYERFGFVARDESIFYGPVVGGPAQVRPLSLDEPADLRLIRERLAERTPVSERCATREPGELALLDLCLWSAGPRLAFIPALECIVVYALRERFLDLYDVIAETIPPLHEIAARLGATIDTAVVYFSPESLAAPQLVAEPTTLIDQLMVRGPWLADARPFALSAFARC